jgi:hypothetical protein
MLISRGGPGPEHIGARFRTAPTRALALADR